MTTHSADRSRTDDADRLIDRTDLDAGRGCNYWTLDPTLRRAVRNAYRKCDQEEGPDRFAVAVPYLREYGGVVGHTIADNADLIDDHGPTLHTYDASGEVQNHIEYHPAQFENEALSYGPDAGIVAYSFDAPPEGDEPLGLVHALSMGALLSYADPGLYCPVSMTAGVALVLDRFDDGHLDAQFDRLTSTDPDELIQGAMFLTEIQGGSDVGATETVAEPIEGRDRAYELTGEKWFCSNLDAAGALALGRRPGAPEGTAGLSLFLLPATKPNGEPNDVLYRRLKDKLGTISVPTGELELQGAYGVLVGEPENGFKQMATMLNFERLANASAAVGICGRCLLESTVHASDREAFGDSIDSYPLMRRDLVEMALDYEAVAAYTFEAAAWLDRVHSDPDDAYAFKLMRLLVPIAKLRTARIAVDTASYAMEIHGGNGYVNDFVTHRLLRDAQVLPIWEGASNVLALDVLRALDREAAHEAFVPEFDERIAAIEAGDDRLTDAASTVRTAFRDLQSALGTLAVEDETYAQFRAKELANEVFDVVTAVALLEAAEAGLTGRDDAREALVARQFVQAELSGGTDVQSGDRSVLESFEPIVWYDRADPAVLE
ncbi:MAG: acyl-CoA dehydrogenase family protein [Halobacteriota archaeon]